MKSTNSAVVVSVNLLPHPNADSLSIVDVGGFNVVVNTESWKGVDKAVYVPIDNMVDTERPEFAFLHKNDKWARVKACKLRGVHSQGVLVPAQPNWKVGDDVTELMGIVHHDTEPEIRTDAERVTHEFANLPKYDIDSHYKMLDSFVEGEEVEVTEKIHGQNSSFCYIRSEDRFYAKARNVWMKQDNSNTLWRAFNANPSMAAFLKENSHLVLCGETYDQVGGSRYGLPPGQTSFACFDIRRKDFSFLDVDERIFLCSVYNVPQVPLLYRGPFSFEKVKSFASGQSTICDHIREGCVVKPIKDRLNNRFDRVVFKVIGEEYAQK